MAAFGYNFIWDMRSRLGYEHFLVATQTEESCTALGMHWDGILRNTTAAARALPCGWVSTVALHPGWDLYARNGTDDANHFALCVRGTWLLVL